MNKEPLRDVTEAEIAAFERDGVVLLKGMFDVDWVEAMEEGFETAIHDLGPLGSNMATAEQGGAYYMDIALWRRHEFFRQLAVDSPGPRLAAQLMRSEKIWLYDDQMFVKEPGTNAPTIFHQDAGYFLIDGMQLCGMWVTPDHVTRATGSLGFIRGSHRWGKVFKPRPFSAASSALYAKTDAGADMEYLPSIEDDIDAHDIVYFDYEPGDCTFHHVRTVHGASGNSHSEHRRRGISVRYCGDDAVYEARPYAPGQPHLEAGLTPGDPIGLGHHPLVWPRA